MASNYIFEKLNDLPIEIEYVEDEHDPEKDFAPSFWFNNRRYYLDGFTRCHNNPWMGACAFPEHIHGVEAEEYYHPLFIELISDDAVNVYEEKEVQA